MGEKDDDEEESAGEMRRGVRMKSERRMREDGREMEFRFEDEGGGVFFRAV